MAANNSSYDLNCDHFTINIKALPPESDETSIEIEVNIVHIRPIGKELFYLISNTHNPEDFTKVFKSEEIFPGESNDWIFSKVTLPKSYLAFSNSQRILLQIMEFDEDHTSVNERGRVVFTIDQALQKTIQQEMNSPVIKGNIQIYVKEYKLLSFVDYITKGLKINLLTAIDFTGSNGHPMDSNSLHFLKSKEPTHYEKAIKACGTILAPYDDDQMIPIYGFGGIPPGKMLVEHVFTLAPYLKNKRFKLNNKFKNPRTSSNMNSISAITKGNDGKARSSFYKSTMQINEVDSMKDDYNINNGNNNEKDKPKVKKSANNFINTKKFKIEEQAKNLEKGVKSVKSIESDDELQDNANSKSSNKEDNENEILNENINDNFNDKHEFYKKEKVLFEEDSVFGLEGVLDAYRSSISKIVFSGPTNFCPLIDKIKTSIKNNLNPQSMNYYILLIITDGQISDMKQTINAIVNSSDLPLSIVIVGVGEDDFTSMKQLDGDDFPLTNYNNKVTARDIVQFVPFNMFKHNMRILGQEILKEIPLQVESYFHFSNTRFK